IDEQTTQVGLNISPPSKPAITVDDLEVAQFVSLLLDNARLRRVIDTVGKKAVLILGRFGERKPVLEALRAALRQRGFVPMIFDFEPPSSGDLTDTVMVLAGMSRFVVADITQPRSVPLEIQAIAQSYMIPVVPILQGKEEQVPLLADLASRHRDTILDVLRYDTIDGLIRRIDEMVIGPAQARADDLDQMKPRTPRERHVEDQE